jgi:hypothetical protein
MMVHYAKFDSMNYFENLCHTFSEICLVDPWLVFHSVNVQLHCTYNCNLSEYFDNEREHFHKQKYTIVVVSHLFKEL